MVGAGRRGGEREREMRSGTCGYYGKVGKGARGDRREKGREGKNKARAVGEKRGRANEVDVDFA